MDALELAKEISHLALYLRERESLPGDQVAVEIQSLTVGAIHPSLVAIERHEVGIGESGHAVEVKLLHG